MTSPATTDRKAEVNELAQDLARRVDKLAQSVGQIGDARLLLMAALLIADELVRGEEGAADS